MPLPGRLAPASKLSQEESKDKSTSLCWHFYSLPSQNHCALFPPDNFRIARLENT
jgi:hypothetical protein